MNLYCRVVLWGPLVLFAESAHGWTNDLKILSIQHTNDCTTLTWKSHPGEFYNVYWTSNLHGNPFWRIAAIHVHSQGTNTIWSECEPGGGEGGMMMMASGGSEQTSTTTLLSPEEAWEWYEANRPAREAAVRYLEDLLRQAVEGAQSPAAPLS